MVTEGNTIIAVPLYADRVQDILNQFDVKYTREVLPEKHGGENWMARVIDD